MNKVLIVVDMQNDFINGALGSAEAEAIVENVKKKIREYRGEFEDVIYTQDTHFGNYLSTHEGQNLPVPHCIHETPGWYVRDDLDFPSDPHIMKYTFGYTSWKNAFRANEIEIDRPDPTFELVGLCTDICVVSNALILRAQYPEAEIIVDASCCAGTTPERHKAALETMKSCQIKVINE